MTEPVHILRLNNGDEFHVRFYEWDMGSTPFSTIFCEELNIGWETTFKEPKVEVYYGHEYLVWICK